MLTGAVLVSGYPESLPFTQCWNTYRARAKCGCFAAATPGVRMLLSSFSTIPLCRREFSVFPDNTWIGRMTAQASWRAVYNRLLEFEVLSGEAVTQRRSVFHEDCFKVSTTRATATLTVSLTQILGDLLMRGCAHSGTGMCSHPNVENCSILPHTKAMYIPPETAATGLVVLARRRLWHRHNVLYCYLVLLI